MRFQSLLSGLIILFSPRFNLNLEHINSEHINICIWKTYILFLSNFN